MLANRLRHRIAIQEQVHTQDADTGASIVYWAPIVLSDGTVMDAVPAEVLTGAGGEFIQSDSQQKEIVARINIRWFEGLLPTMRITWNGNLYRIEDIQLDVTARQEYRIRCSAGVNDGQ